MKIICIGEILWDVFPDVEHLGGATFNFAAHARRLGHDVVFISAVGDDERGRAARARAAALGLPAEFIRTVPGAQTGIVAVKLDASGQPSFTIHRPAAYDLLELGEADYSRISRFGPDWIYYGTLYQTSPHTRELVRKAVEHCPRSKRLYDINLRRDSYTPVLVEELFQTANVVKLNEDEAATVGSFLGLPHNSIEEFCRLTADRFHLDAVCVTRGGKGCAILSGREYAEVAGYSVAVRDTVGAGDAFAAAFLHGLSQGWPPGRTGDFANRLGALVASRQGAIPPWSLEECEALARPAPPWN
jgi:fructokinase